ncbi:MAG: DNA-deoxyinosine glycosylase [Methyloprofundus sp.]|nr:DNA-deoxyinosine glycosylase [Methyloprofundus sp.]
MATTEGFNLLADDQARTLILGSMPSVISLAEQQYYAHPRNAFWPIIAALFNQGGAVDYQRGQQILIEQNIALWDVLKSCTRQGSLDSAIEKNSITVNDFMGFFEAYKGIERVFFNGGTAEKFYKTYVWRSLPVSAQTLRYTKLPSTSPAFAAMSYQAKLAAWAVIKEMTE